MSGTMATVRLVEEEEEEWAERSFWAFSSVRTVVITVWFLERSCSRMWPGGVVVRVVCVILPCVLTGEWWEGGLSSSHVISLSWTVKSSVTYETYRQ
jgi:hypothetical protein